MKGDLYAEVSTRIVAELEAGAAWVKPWSATPGANTPCNAVSNRPYSGCNIDFNIAENDVKTSMIVSAAECKIAEGFRYRRRHMPTPLKSWPAPSAASPTLSVSGTNRGPRSLIRMLRPNQHSSGSLPASSAWQMSYDGIIMNRRDEQDAKGLARELIRKGLRVSAGTIEGARRVGPDQMEDWLRD
jgi:hypothetical protein